MKKLIMKYRSAAQDSVWGWENESLPLGNGFLGVNVFGIVERDRLQFTHNALVNPKESGGLNNLAELYLKFPHTQVTDYERGLCLDDASAYCHYVCDGVKYSRQYFASYPDRVVVVDLTASEKGKLEFEVQVQIPYLKDYGVTEGDGAGKSGTVNSSEDCITFRGELHYYHVLFEGRIKVLTDGELSSCGQSLKIENASCATLIVGAETNYKLCKEAFLEEGRNKTRGEDPHEAVEELVTSAASLGAEKLLERHLADYHSLFGRVSLSLAGSTEAYMEDMMEAYRAGKQVPYLEEMYFQYGRYLLISSSRKGGLPANLQGIWNCHDQSPWGSGYWHNINVQMNYWPAFNTNLLETFEPYIDFYRAYLPKAEQFASEYIKEYNPECYTEEEGECGWTIGTASYPYSITPPGAHSGPGTGGLTSKLFWEAYAFSQDKELLEKVTYPALLGMSKLLTKTVKEYDGKYLVSPSASPEQMNGAPIGGKVYYRTVGCAFDQQMLYENGLDLLKAADELCAYRRSGGKGELSEKDLQTIALQKYQLDKYDPVKVGWSGQIKEYDEENFYGEIGAYNHRHISQLMALHPGTQINTSTPAWMDAARVSLESRGNNATGWALGHRLNTWARLGDGNASYEVIRKLLSEKTMINLWDLHPPFQIDGNFGATAGIAEMLIQSHNDGIEILPALPDAWEEGSVEGLLARGGFEVGIVWKNKTPVRVTVTSLQGNLLTVRHPGSGDLVRNRPTEKGECCIFEDFRRKEELADPEEITAETTEGGVILHWNCDRPVNIYRAVESSPVYETAALDVWGDTYTDCIDFAAVQTVTYKLKAVGTGTESRGKALTVNHATRLELDRYENSILKLLLPDRSEW